jgi:hypothetical protein
MGLAEITDIFPRNDAGGCCEFFVAISWTEANEYNETGKVRAAAGENQRAVGQPTYDRYSLQYCHCV